MVNRLSNLHFTHHLWLDGDSVLLSKQVACAVVTAAVPVIMALTCLEWAQAWIACMGVIFALF